MPINPKYLAKFYAGNYYHIYNRSHSQKQMFLYQDNYTFFLQLLKKYLSDYVDFFAYCLLPNHFHLFVKVKETMRHDEDINKTISNQFKKMFIAYVKAFNTTYNMHGGMFETPFRRKLIDDDSYFSSLVYYIHCNPQHHNIKMQLKNYPYSSYTSFLSNKPTLLQREQVLDWFGGVNNFIKYHNIQKKNYLVDEFRTE